MQSYKIYINDNLHAAFYSQAKFKEEAHRLELLHKQIFNQSGSFLKSNVKTC